MPAPSPAEASTSVSPSVPPSAAAVSHRKSIVRQLFDTQNGFVKKRGGGYHDFVLEDLECLLEDELTIEGKGGIRSGLVLSYL